MIHILIDSDSSIVFQMSENVIFVQYLLWYSMRWWLSAILKMKNGGRFELSQLNIKHFMANFKEIHKVRRIFFRSFWSAMITAMSGKFLLSPNPAELAENGPNRHRNTTDPSIRFCSRFNLFATKRYWSCAGRIYGLQPSASRAAILNLVLM